MYHLRYTISVFIYIYISSMGYTIFVAEQPPKKSTPNVGKTQTPTPTLRQICALYARSAAEGRISARSSSKTSGCDLILRGTAG